MLPEVPFGDARVTASNVPEAHRILSVELLVRRVHRCCAFEVCDETRTHCALQLALGATLEGTQLEPTR